MPRAVVDDRYQPRLEDALAVIDAATPEARDHEGFSQYQELADHIIALASFLQDSNPDAAVRILTACGSNQEVRAAYTDALSTLNLAFELEKTTNGASTKKLAEILNLTGIVQQDLARLEEAETTQARALAINEAVYGPFQAGNS